MNGFTDVVVTFGPAAAPSATRLGNPWQRVADGPGAVWSATGDGTTVPTARRGSWTVWVVGELVSYRGRSSEPLERFAADVSAGRAAPVDLDGQAVIVAWDEATRRLHVWVDRMGTVHAYVGGSPGQARMGTSFAAVAEASRREPDWLGITGFCGFGLYPADRTRYDDVRILRPATHSVFDDQGRLVSQERYWDWWFDPVERSDDEVVDEFHEVWTNALAQRTEGRRAVVPVSGGLDSRTVLADLAPVGGGGPAGPHAFTYGYSATSVEIRIARKVAAARGLRADELVVEPYLFDRLDDVVDAVEGFQALTLTRQAGVSAAIAAMGDLVVGGHWGDVWFDAAGAAPGVDPVDAAFAKFAKRGREWLFEHLCRPHLDGDPEELLREVLAAEIARLPDLGDADVQLKALKTEQWSFRWTLASTRAYQIARPVSLPFYANDVVDLFLTIPAEQLVGRRLQKAYLRRHHPDLAAIVWQDTGMSLWEKPWEPSAALARRAVAKGWRLARREQVVERNWEVQYLVGEGPARLRGLIERRVGVLADLPDDARARLVDDLLSAPHPATAQGFDALATLSSAPSGSW